MKTAVRNKDLGLSNVAKILFSPTDIAIRYILQAATFGVLQSCPCNVRVTIRKVTCGKIARDIWAIDTLRVHTKQRGFNPRWKLGLGAWLSLSTLLLSVSGAVLIYLRVHQGNMEFFVDG